MWHDTLSRPIPVGQALAAVGLEHRAGVRVASLSGGERRRLDLALALMGRPAVLVFDEPTTATSCSTGGSISGMTVKLTISLPDELAEEARRAVRDGRAESVSGYVGAAIEHYRRAQTLDDWLDQMDAELGPPSDEAIVWAESMIGPGPARRASA